MPVLNRPVGRHPTDPHRTRRNLVSTPATGPGREFDTAALHGYVDRWRAGDRAAADELLRAAGQRLERLARRMLRGFPNVGDVAQAEDVLQGSLVRLFRTLQKIRPASTRDFFNLAAVQMRRELIDLARRYGRRERSGADTDVAGVGRPAPDDGADLDRWAEFHGAVDRLPEEEGEVVGLVFYHGWSQRQIADLLGVDERTVRRRWAAACQRLRHLAGPGE